MALAVVVVLLAATHPRRLVLVPAVLILGAALTQVPAISSRLSHEFSPNDPNNTVLSRVALWEATLRMLKDHPLFGAGLFGFARTIDAYRGGVYDEKLIYPHNVVLNFWSETGLLGLLAIAAVVVQGFRTAWTGWRSGPVAWRALQLGVLLALVAILVHGMVDVPYFKNDLSLEFWTLLALSAAGRLSPSAAA
jgi:O-antigen ligase